jgi:8-oxo-dGTP pyrophosphatase MutT (NUDIX family)
MAGKLRTDESIRLQIIASAPDRYQVWREDAYICIVLWYDCRTTDVAEEPRYMSDNLPATPRPAAALVLLRDTIQEGNEGIEVFMVRRHIQSDFAPDVFVFPGGKVKLEDRTLESGIARATAQDDPTTLGTGFRAAAIRECFEEAGVLLARRGEQPLDFTGAEAERFTGYRIQLQRKEITLNKIVAGEGLTLMTDALVHWAHWITPKAWPKRFDTHFFLGEAPQGQLAAHDELETTESVWIAPEVALSGFESGAFPLVFATVHQLRDLSAFASYAAARERFMDVTPETIMPRIVEREGASVILMPGEE